MAQAKTALLKLNEGDEHLAVVHPSGSGNAVKPCARRGLGRQFLLGSVLSVALDGLRDRRRNCGRPARDHHRRKQIECGAGEHTGPNARFD
jgi:hypothetical protein